jgi:hypothetical protein
MDRRSHRYQAAPRRRDDGPVGYFSCGRCGWPVAASPADGARAPLLCARCARRPDPRLLRLARAN